MSIEGCAVAILTACWSKGNGPWEADQVWGGICPGGVLRRPTADGHYRLLRPASSI